MKYVNQFFRKIFNAHLIKAIGLALFLVCINICSPVMSLQLVSDLYEVNMTLDSISLSFIDNLMNFTMKNNYQILSNNVTSCRITEFRIFAFLGIGTVNINIKIRNNFIEIRYCISNRFVILVTNYRFFSIQEVSRKRRNNRFISKHTR